MAEAAVWGDDCKENKGVIHMSLQMSTDLYSMGQFLQEGRQIFFETVLTVERIRQDVSFRGQSICRSG